MKIFKSMRLGAKKFQIISDKIAKTCLYKELDKISRRKIHFFNGDKFFDENITNEYDGAFDFFNPDKKLFKIYN